MLLAQEFHNNAELCSQMANSAADPLTKTAWQRLAKKWRALECHETEAVEQVSTDAASSDDHQRC
jgi:hypothetical protein